MNSLQNTGRSARLTGNIEQTYSGQSLQAALNVLTDEFTIQTGDDVGTYADFVPFTSDGYLDLENSRIRIGGLITAALNNTVKLQKVIGTPQKFAATTTASSTAVVTSRTGLLAGQSVAGVGIPAGATIVAVTATGFTMSAGATATGATTITLTGTADITAAATVAASAATAATAAQAVPFVGLNGGPPVTFLRGDKLRLVLVSVTSLGIGRSLITHLPYVARLAPGLNP